MNSTASTVFGLSSDGAPDASWRNEPKLIRRERSAMLESGSLAWPRPIGCPSCFSSGAASRTCSQRRRRLADRVPQVVAPDHRSRDEVVGDAEVLPGLRVERAPATEIAVPADLTLDLAHDRRVVDHLILVACGWSEEAEDVVTALRLDLCRGQSRKLRIRLALDRDLDVVALSPSRSPTIGARRRSAGRSAPTGRWRVGPRAGGRCA